MKWKKWLYAYLGLWLVFPWVVFAIWVQNYDVLLGTEGTPFAIQQVLNRLGAVCVIALAILHYRETEKRWTNKLALAAAALGIIALVWCWNFTCTFFHQGECRHTFTSPDGKYTIVVTENISPIAGKVHIHERVNPFLIRYGKEIITDDGYCPICAGQYELTWKGNAVTLTVADGAGGWETATVHIGK